MGYDRHHALVVSGFGEQVESAHAEALRIFNRPRDDSAPWDIVSPIIASPANDVRTFFIAPDGSKEGWATSNEGDARRAEFVAYLKSQEYANGESPFWWVEVQYGDDYLETKVVSDSDATMRALESD